MPVEVDFEEFECDALCELCTEQLLQTKCSFVEEVHDGEIEEPRSTGGRCESPY